MGVESDFGKKIFMSPIGFCACGEHIWFLQLGSNLMLSLNLHNMEICDARRIPECCSLRDGTYTEKLIVFKEKIFIFLSGESRSYCFDTKKDKFIESIEFPDGFRLSMNCVVEKDNQILILPYNDRYILRMDMDSGQIEKNKISENNISFQKEVILENNSIIASECNSNRVWAINTDTLKTDIYSVGDKENSYFGICSFGQDKYALPFNDGSGLLLTDKRFREERFIPVPEKYEYLTNAAFIKMFADSSLYLFPQDSDAILKLRMNNNILECVTDRSGFKACKNEDGKFISQVYNDAIKIGDFYYTFYIMKQEWHILDSNTGELSCVGNKIQHQYIAEEISKLFDNREHFETVLKEGYTNATLENFIAAIL